MNFTNRTLALAFTALLIFFHVPAFAQKWPDRGISILIGVGPGGNIDLLSRALATRLQDRLGVPVIIKNRPGGNGLVALDDLARSEPNGYSFSALGVSALLIATQMQEIKTSREDLDFVAGWVVQRYGMAVRSDSPFQTVEDLVNASKSSGGLFFGVSSAVHSLIIYEFAAGSGAKIDLVNYKSAPEVMNGLLGGQIMGAVLNPSDIVPHVTSGKLRFLAAGGPGRWPEYPNVPTFTQMGYDVKSASTFTGIGAPKGVPADVMKRMESEISAAVKDKEFQAAINKLGAETVFMSGEDYKAYINKNRSYFGGLVRSAGLGK